MVCYSCVGVQVFIERKGSIPALLVVRLPVLAVNELLWRYSVHGKKCDRLISPCGVAAPWVNRQCGGAV